MDFQALVPGSSELHLLCHVTLLYCQVDPKTISKAKSKAKKSLLPLPILPLMWQPLAHLNQCYSSNSLPFPPVWFGPYCKLFLRQPALQCVILERRNTVGSSNNCAKIRKSFLEHNIPQPCFLSCLSLLYSLLSLLMAQPTRNDCFLGGISSMFNYYFYWTRILAFSNCFFGTTQFIAAKFYTCCQKLVAYFVSKKRKKASSLRASEILKDLLFTTARCTFFLKEYKILKFDDCMITLIFNSSWYVAKFLNTGETTVARVQNLEPHAHTQVVETMSVLYCTVLYNLGLGQCLNNLEVGINKNHHPTPSGMLQNTISRVNLLVLTARRFITLQSCPLHQIPARLSSGYNNNIAWVSEEYHPDIARKVDIWTARDSLWTT